MNSQQEELFDAMIKIAGSEAMQEDIDAMPPESEIDVTFTPGFERKMRRLIRQHRRSARSVPMKLLRFAAACIALLALTFTSAFALIPAFRERVITELVRMNGKSAEFSYGNTDGIRPAYVPEGFTEVVFWDDGDTMVDICYINENEVEILFSKVLADGLSIVVDSEHSDYSQCVINGYEAHIFTSNTEGYPSYIIFFDGTYTYTFSGIIPIDELISMAESTPAKKSP